MDSITQAVIDRLKERAETAPAKYAGKTMDRDDLTALEWDLHLQGELMDAVIYLEKRIQMNQAFSSRPPPLELENQHLRGIIARSALQRLHGEQSKTMHVTAGDIADSLAVLYAYQDAKPTPAPPSGTQADYEKDVADAQAAYDANKSSGNYDDLSAAESALKRHFPTPYQPPTTRCQCQQCRDHELACLP